MKKKIVWITLTIAIWYWIVESFMDTLVMEDTTFAQRLFALDSNELWMRFTVVALIIGFGFYSARLLSKLRRSDDKLIRLNSCFLDFGPDPVDNINRLTALSGEILGSSSAFYNRMDHDQLSPWAKWCPDGVMPPEETPRGHICRDLIHGASDEVKVIRNLPETTYAAEEACIISCGLHTYMGKTVSLGEQVVGSLSVIYKTDYSPTEDDKRFIGIIASAIGVEEIRRRAQVALRESEDRLRHLSSELLTAQDKERRRLALQLHDSVGQSLSALKFGIEVTLESLGSEVDSQKIEPLKVSVPLIRQIIAEIRQLQKDLYPATLDELGIISTINSFCKQYGEIYRNIRLETRITIEESEAPRALKPVIYRIMQEAMNNVAKHSGADHVSIGLQRIDHALRLTVEDNGAGFDISLGNPDLFKKGLGLSSMKERAELSGGKFLLQSETGKGTRLTVTWTEDRPAVNLQ